MDYKTLVAKTAEEAGISRAAAWKVLGAFRDVAVGALKDGDSIKFANFGTFRMVRYRATQRRDPNTHVVKAIPERMKPKFSFSRIAEEEVSS